MDGQLRQQLSLGDFLSFKGPTGEVADHADPKATFLAKLGMDETLYTHKQVFDKMMEAEAQLQAAMASEDLQRLLANSTNHGLQLALTHNGLLLAVKQKIYDTACPQTRFIYDLVRDERNECWVIDWTLWQALAHRGGWSIGKTHQTPDKSNAKVDLTSSYSPSAEQGHIDIPGAEPRTQSEEAGILECRASRTPPGKSAKGFRTDSVSSKSSPVVLSPMSVQHLLNAQDDDL